MIRRLLLAAIVGIMSLPMVAQDDDDMYFVPKKQSKDVIEFEKGDGTYDLSALDYNDDVRLGTLFRWR
mgnify:CR=1 FL=1